MIVLLYYSAIFILGLYLLGDILSGKNQLDRSESYVTRIFYIACIAYVCLCMCNVAVGVSGSDVLDKVCLYLSEFIRMCILINLTELCAVITNRKSTEKSAVYVVSSELFYLGIVTLIVRAIVGESAIRYGIFGTQFVMGQNFGTIINIVFNVIILFFMGAYTYSFYYTCTKKREIYIFRKCLYMVTAISISLFIESFCYIELGEYIPVMMLGMMYSIVTFKKLLLYRRKIEYNESDYKDILSPSYDIPAFVCNDDGVVIFENTRAFVMRQMYKDAYTGSYLSDIFEMSMYDMERLRDPSLVQPFEIFCNYKKEPLEVKLIIRHRLDRYQEIFSTEIEFEFIGEYDYENPASQRQGRLVRILLSDLSYEDRNDLRIDALICMMETQKKLYENHNKILFLANLKGILKMSNVLSISTLNELCLKIEELVDLDNAWDKLDGMMIDIDRQLETFKLLV